MPLSEPRISRKETETRENLRFIIIIFYYFEHSRLQLCFGVFFLVLETCYTRRKGEFGGFFRVQVASSGATFGPSTFFLLWKLGYT